MQMTMHPGTLPDPLRMEPLALSLDAVVTWLDRVGARLDPASPLAFLIPAPRPEGEAGRDDALAELARWGIILEPQMGQRRPPAGEYWMWSLKVLAAPRARLRLALWTDDGGQGLFPFFLNGRWAVYFGFDEDHFHIGPPLPVDTLKTALIRHLAVRDAQLRSRNVTVPGTAFRWLVYLWVAQREVMTPVLGESDLQARLEQTPVTRDQIRSVLDLLIDLGYVERSTSGYALVEPYDHWIRIFAAGQAVELEMTWFSTGTHENAPRDGVLFVGPPQARALCQGLSLDRWHDARVTPPAEFLRTGSEAALMLAHLDLGETLQLVDTLITA